MVRPAKPRSNSARKSGTGADELYGSAGSCPAMTSSRATVSSTVRPSGPVWSSVELSALTPLRLTRPNVGLWPVTPHNAAGMRIEPPVSVPRPAATTPAAMAAPVPPLEPPGMRSSDHGLRVGGVVTP